MTLNLSMLSALMHVHMLPLHCVGIILCTHNTSPFPFWLKYPLTAGSEAPSAMSADGNDDAAGEIQPAAMTVLMQSFTPRRLMTILQALIDNGNPEVIAALQPHFVVVDPAGPIERANAQALKLDKILVRIIKSAKRLGFDDHVWRQARELIRTQTTPLCKGAAEASLHIHDAIARLPERRIQPYTRRMDMLLVADRKVRDVLQLRIRECMTDPTDRNEFLIKAKEGLANFKDRYDFHDFISRLLQAYAKDPTSQVDGAGFKSNNSIDAERRGHSRARHRKKLIPVEGLEELSACAAEEPSAPALVSTVIGEPMYVTLPGVRGAAVYSLFSGARVGPLLPDLAGYLQSPSSSSASAAAAALPNAEWHVQSRYDDDPSACGPAMNYGDTDAAWYQQYAAQWQK